MRVLNDYGEIREGMTLRCLSEDYEGTVVLINGVLQTDCMGWGFEPISCLDLDDVVVVSDD